MTAYDQVFYPIFGVGCVIALIASFFAARKSGYVVPVALLVVGMVAFWAGMLIGCDKGYRAWQSIPSPPDEAFYDGEKVWALFFGWLPGAVFCGLVFGFTRLHSASLGLLDICFPATSSIRISLKLFRDLLRSMAPTKHPSPNMTNKQRSLKNK